MWTCINSIKKLSTLFLIVTFISGCASSSSSIKPAYVSPLAYQDYNCGQVGQEMSRVGRQVAEVSGQQDSTAGKDAYMVGASLVFWPSLFFLAAGEDRKGELGRLKGEADALEQSAIAKQCTTILAQLEEAKKLHMEQEVDAHLVEARREECVDMLGESACNSTDFEAEIRKEQAAALKLEKPATPNSNNEPQTASIKPSPTVQPQHISSKVEVYKTKCTHCGNVVAYQEKYSGSSSKCMQCDRTFELP
jgi:hypothetical protein